MAGNARDAELVRWLLVRSRLRNDSVGYIIATEELHDADRFSALPCIYVLHVRTLAPTLRELRAPRSNSLSGLDSSDCNDGKRIMPVSARMRSWHRAI